MSRRDRWSASQSLDQCETPGHLELTRIGAHGDLLLNAPTAGGASAWPTRANLVVAALDGSVDGSDNELGVGLEQLQVLPHALRECDDESEG